jgi:hypothetical protein
MTIMEKPVSTPASSVVGSFISEARLDALNAALAAHGVDASRIITIFQMPGQPVANGHAARYHVLYRKP